MVAVFTGLGAGFERGSATQVGVLGSGAQGRAGENISVNAATGNLVVSTRLDEFLVGRGPDVGVSRTYNSRGALDDNGDHWRQSSDRRVYGLTGTVNTNGSTVKRVGADGAEVTYTYHSTYRGMNHNGDTITGSYRATDGAGAHDSLVYGSGKWTWNNGDSGIRETYFGAGGYIKEQFDRDDNKVTFTYNASNQLYRVSTANNGYVQYNWSGNRIESITSSAEGVTADYQYDSSGRLSKVVNDGYWVSYSYHGTSKQIKSITQKDGSRIDFTYDAQGRVYDVHQYPGNGEPTRTTKFRYAANGSYTDVYDPSGVRSILYHDGKEQLTQARIYAPDQGIDYSTYYTYDAAGNVLTVKDAQGNTTTNTYDTRGNLTKVKDAQGNEKLNNYNDRNQLVRTYYLANTEANETGEWILEHYIYDAEGHLRYTIDGDQNVTELEYDTYGNLRFTKQYVDKEYGRTWTIQNEVNLNNWVNGLTNAERQNTIIRENRFDALGNIIQTVAWSSATTSATPTGGDGYTHTIYTHDHQGRILTSRVSGLTTQTFAYDAMGRMISSTDQNGGATTISFNDAATHTTITSASGLVTLKVYNKAGDLISETNSGKRVTTGTIKYEYDKNGRVRVRKEVSGGHTSNSGAWYTYYVYDKAGNLTAEVDNTGFVQEFRYDKNGRQIAHARYTRYKATAARNAMLATLKDPNNTLQAKDLRHSVDQAANHHGYDIWQWTAYDSRGQVSRTVMGDGSVMAYSYDKAGRLVKTHSYFNKLNGTQLAALRGGTATAASYTPSANTAKDQVTRTFYNRGGQLAGTLDGNGYLTAITYDKAGRKIQESVFGNKATNLTGTFNQVNASVVKSSAKDAHTRYVYDGQFLRYTVDALNKVTEFVYKVGGYHTANGVVRSTIQHYATLGNLSNYKLATVKSAVAALGSKSANRTNWNVYNNRNQLVYTIDAAGSVARMTYNTDGTVAKVYEYSVLRPTTSMPSEAAMNSFHNAHWGAGRVTQTYYNARGQIDYVVDPEYYVTTFNYDRAGRKISESRWSTKFNYWQTDTEGEVVAASKGAESKTRYTYQANGALSSVFDANGTRNYLGYYANGALAWEIQAYGQGTEQESRVLHINDAAGRKYVTRQYVGSYTDSADPDYRKYRQTYQYYDGTGNVSRVREYAGNHAFASDTPEQNTYFYYDKAGNLIQKKDAEGASTYYTYNAFGQVETTKDPYNVITTNIYNNAGQLTRTTDNVGLRNSTVIARHTDFTYNAFGEQETVTRGGQTTTYYYDKIGRNVRVKDANNQSSYLTYDAFGNALTSKDRRGTVTSNTYDRRGLMTSTVTEGIRTNYTYDSRGNTLTITTAVGRAEQAVTHYTYDKADRLVSTKDALNKTEHYKLDRRGNITEVTDKLGHKSITTFDALNRVVTKKDALGGVETYSYDANGNVRETKNKLGGITYHKYDRLNRLVETRTPDTGSYAVESITTFKYDKNSNLIEQVEAAGHVEARTTKFEYDAANRLIKKTGDAVSIYTSGADSTVTNNHIPTETFKYDLNNNLIESIDANGARTLHWYDKLNRLTHQLSAEGTLTRNWYDAEGNETDIRVYSHKYTNSSYNPTGNPPSGTSNINNYRRTTFAYDRLNRMTNSYVHDVQTAKFGTSLSITATTNDLRTQYQYDANGNVIKVIDPNGGQTTSQYDKLGRKTRQVDAGGYVIDWTYNALGDVTRELKHDAAGGSGNRITDFFYDKNGNRTGETRYHVKVFNGSTGETTAHSNISYLYNALGQVTRKTEATGEYINYKYDNQGKLEYETRSGYVDHLGGPAVTPRVNYYYNGLNDVSRVFKYGKTGSISHSDSHYTYAKGGRLTSVTDGNGFVRTYRYDAKGQMVREEYVRVTNGASQTEGIGYDFDKEGRVVAQGAVVKSGSTWSRGGNSLDTVNTKYNAFGDVSERGINGKYSEKMDYDKAGRLWRTTSGDGAYKYFMHDNNGNQTLVFTSDGRNIDNKSIAQILAIWGVSSNGANANRISTDYETDITATITKYDARNLAVEVREPEREYHNASGTKIRADFITKRGYNAFGEVVSETDANNKTISYEYNTMGRRIKVVSPQIEIANTSNPNAPTLTNPTEYYYYDISGRLVASKDANGNLTKQTLLAGTGYNGTQALITETIAADGGRVKTAYDIQGNARKITDQLNRVTTNSFDKMGNLTQINHASGLIDYYSYDGLGQQYKHWNNVAVTASYYDKLTGTTIPGGPDFASTDYDAQGRIVVQRAIGGDITATSYVWSATGVLAANGGWLQTTTVANGKQSKVYKDVFNKAIRSYDLSNRQVNYTYDKGGRLTNVSGAGADTQAYHYLNTNKLDKMVVSGSNYDYAHFNASSFTRTTTYGYDKVGNLTLEQLKEHKTVTHTEVFYEDYYGGYQPETYTWTENKYTTLKNARATYDALGRIKSWNELGTAAQSGYTAINPAASKAFEYDAQGNIRRTTSTFKTLDAQGVASSTATTKETWYNFDAMNRITTAEGQLVGGQVVRGTQGVDIAYDAAGQRKYTVKDVITSTYTKGGGYTSTTTTTRENYTYNTGGQVTQVRVATTTNGTLPSATGTLRSVMSYDAMGRQITQKDYEANGTTVAFQSTKTYNNKSQITNDTSITKRSDGIFKGVTTYAYGSGASYALGAATTVTTANYKNNSHQNTSRTTNAYAYYNGASLSSTSLDGNISSSSDRITSTNYANSKSGVLISARINDGRARTVSFTVDNQGQTIRRDEKDHKTGGDPHEIWYRFGGKEMGYVGNNGSYNTNYTQSITDRTRTPTTGENAGAFKHGSTTGSSHADFDQAYQAINSYKQGSTSGTYTVRAGDTLQGIAANIYGDSSLWYKIAAANGMTGEAALIEGQSLNLPSGVVKSTHNASTFKPYSPGDIQGDLNPTTPLPQKAAKGKKCGVLGAILLVVVAVVVTIATQGALAGFIGTAASGTGASAVAATGLTAAIGSTGATIVGGAIAAAAGSIASQVVGVATGIQEKFSWKGVALAAIGGGVGAGLSGVSGLSGATGKVGQFAQGAARGALGSAISQGIGVATGLQDSFSWASVAAAGVGGGVSAIASSYLPGAETRSDAGGLLTRATIFNDLASSGAAAIANAATRSAIDGSNFGDNLIAAIPDIIGGVIGQRLGNALHQGACFTAETPVHTPYGLKRIDEIKVGDWVYSRDEYFNSDVVVRRRVIELYRYENRTTLDVTVSFGGASETTLRTTPEHPFAVMFPEDEFALEENWGLQSDTAVLTKAIIWCSAKNLQIGDVVVDIQGRQGLVTALEPVGHLHTVHNFAVEDHHTYYVGEQGIWVHNEYTAQELHDLMVEKLGPQKGWTGEYFDQDSYESVGFEILKLRAVDPQKANALLEIFMAGESVNAQRAAQAVGSADAILTDARTVLADGKISTTRTGLISDENQELYQILKLGAVVENVTYSSSYSPLPGTGIVHRSGKQVSYEFSEKVLAGLMVDLAYGSAAGETPGNPGAALDMLDMALHDPGLSAAQFENLTGRIAGAPSRARWGGLARFVGSGIATIGAGLFTIGSSPTGVGAVAGGAATVVSADSTVAGFRQLWTGKPVASGLTHALMAAGLSENRASLVSGMTEFAAGFVGVGAAANVARLSRMGGPASKMRQILGNAPPNHSLTDEATRLWYLTQESKIGSMINTSASLENQARQAHLMRNIIRSRARNLMSNRGLAQQLGRSDPNLSWQQVLTKYNGDHKAIVDAAMRSRKSVNKKFGLD